MTDLKTSIMKAAEFDWNKSKESWAASGGESGTRLENFSSGGSIENTRLLLLIERLAECVETMGVLIEDTDNYESWVMVRFALLALKENLK